MYLVLSLIQLMNVQSGHHNHSIECTLFFPWFISYIRERTRYIRYYDCDVHFVQSSAVSGKEQGTFDTMMMMSTLYNHQQYQGKNKVHSIVLSLIQLMTVQSVHHNHSIECTLFFPWYSWWLYKVDIITMIVMSTLYNHQLYQGKNKVHSILWLWCPLCTIISCIRERTRYIRYIECTLFFPWYSWWLYKVYITIIVSNVSCSFPCTLCTIIRYIRVKTRYIRYYDCDVHFVQSSAVSGKEQGTFDTMIIIVSNVPCSFPDIADECTKCTSQS
jgi:hypothetical protein